MLYIYTHIYIYVFSMLYIYIYMYIGHFEYNPFVNCCARNISNILLHVTITILIVWGHSLVSSQMLVSVTVIYYQCHVGVLSAGRRLSRW